MKYLTRKNLMNLTAVTLLPEVSASYVLYKSIRKGVFNTSFNYLKELIKSNKGSFALSSVKQLEYSKINKCAHELLKGYFIKSTLIYEASSFLIGTKLGVLYKVNTTLTVFLLSVLIGTEVKMFADYKRNI